MPQAIQRWHHRLEERRPHLGQELPPQRRPPPSCSPRGRSEGVPPNHTFIFILHRGRHEAAPVQHTDGLARSTWRTRTFYDGLARGVPGVPGVSTSNSTKPPTSNGPRLFTSNILLLLTAPLEEIEFEYLCTACRRQLINRTYGRLMRYGRARLAGRQGACLHATKHMLAFLLRRRTSEAGGRVARID